MKIIAIIGCLMFSSILLFSHPMPNSYLNLIIGDDKIVMDLEIPVQEFELAFDKDLLNNSSRILTVYQSEIKSYLTQHIAIKSLTGIDQPIEIISLGLDSIISELSGRYLELQAKIEVPVKADFDPRHFMLHYDAIIHQVSNHFSIVRIKQDFRNAIMPHDSTVLAAIRLDVPSNSIKPLEVSLDEGSRWKGFWSMFSLGMHHIRVGTDHILFFITLILIAPLRTVDKNRWSLFQGWRYSIDRFLKISLAFTIGHSISLFFGAVELFPFNIQLIEILIAFSILLSAINCIKPIFYSQEIWIALGFGCVHGLAFSESISGLDLSTANKALSILGFNLGIEAMQIVIMVLFLPLFILSKWKGYHYFRIAIAAITFIAAVLWAIERISGTTIIS